MLNRSTNWEAYYIDFTATWESNVELKLSLDKYKKEVILDFHFFASSSTSEESAVKLFSKYMAVEKLPFEDRVKRNIAAWTRQYMLTHLMHPAERILLLNESLSDISVDVCFQTEKTYGLKLVTALSIRNLNSVPPIKVRDKVFRTVVQHLADPVDLKVDVDLHPIPGREFRAMILSEQETELEAVVIRSLQDYLEEKLSVTELLYDLDAKIIPDAQSLIDKELNPWGYKARSLVMNVVTEFPLPPVQLSINHTANGFIYNPKGHKIEIKVLHDLDLTLIDREKFFRQAVDDPEKHVIELLDRQTKHYIWNNGLDVFENSSEKENIEKTLRDSLKSEVLEFGYKVEHIVVLLNPLEVNVLERVLVEFEEDFKTADPGISILLNFRAEGPVADRMKLLQRIAPDQPMQEEIRKKCIQRMENRIIAEKAVSLYFNYYGRVANDLDRIAREILQEYQVMDAEISIHPHNSILEKSLLELKRKDYKLKFNVNPFKMNIEGESLEFTIRYEVRGPHEPAFDQFHNKLKLGLEKFRTNLEEQMVEQLKYELETYRLDSLRYISPRGRITLLQRLNMVIAPLQRRFGVKVVITQLGRELSDSDLEITERVKAIKSRIATLKMKESIELEHGKSVRDEKIIIIREEITRLNEELNTLRSQAEASQVEMELEDDSHLLLGVLPNALPPTTSSEQVPTGGASTGEEGVKEESIKHGNSRGHLGSKVTKIQNSSSSSSEPEGIASGNCTINEKSLRKAHETPSLPLKPENDDQVEEIVELVSESENGKDTVIDLDVISKMERKLRNSGEIEESEVDLELAMKIYRMLKLRNKK
ncbi:MAG: hypothetical protein AAF998_23050 [Bacteroidota bacterium]